MEFLLNHIARLDCQQSISDPMTTVVGPINLTNWFLEEFSADNYIIQVSESSSEIENTTDHNSSFIPSLLKSSLNTQECLIPKTLTPIDKLSHPTLRRYSAEYVASKTLFDLGTWLETRREYSKAALAFSIIIKANVTWANRGKCFLRLITDNRLHLKLPEQALYHAFNALSEISHLGAGDGIKIATRAWDLCLKLAGPHKKSRFKMKPQNPILLSNDTTKTYIQGYYRAILGSGENFEIRDIAPHDKINVAQIILEKQIASTNHLRLICFLLKLIKAADIALERRVITADAAPVLSTPQILTPTKSPQIQTLANHGFTTPTVLSMPTVSPRTETTNRPRPTYKKGDQAVSVEEIALVHYIGGATLEESPTKTPYRTPVKRRKTSFSNLQASLEGDWTGCHCEGALIREIVSVLCFPLLFHNKVCRANIHSFLSDTQSGPSDLPSGESFFSARKEDIEAYLDDILEISDSELCCLLSWACSHIYEIKLPGSRWMADETYPAAFKPDINFNWLLGSTSRLRKTPQSKYDGDSPPIMKSWQRWRNVQGDGDADIILGYKRISKLKPFEFRQAERDQTFSKVCQEADEERRKSGLLYGFELAWIAACIGRKVLTVCCYNMIRQWSHWCSGLPDLLLWKNVPVQKMKDEFIIYHNILPEPLSLSNAANRIAWAFTNMNPEAVNGFLAVEKGYRDISGCEVSIATKLQKEIASISRVIGLFPFSEIESRLVEVKGPGDSLSQKQRSAAAI